MLNIGTAQIPLNGAKRPAGWKHTDEARAKIRAKRALQVITLETREKMRIARLGRKHTQEELQKMSVSQIGRVFSNETRLKMSAWQIGERNSRWKGGITPFRRKLRNLGKYIEWREKIIQRDIGCVVCDTENEIEVDHFPMTLKDILEKFKIDSVEKAIVCAALWDIKNGRVLCKTHHKEVTHGYPLSKLKTMGMIKAEGDMLRALTR